MYVVSDKKIAKGGQNIFQVQKEQEVNEGPSGNDKGNSVAEKKLLEGGLISHFHV